MPPKKRAASTKQGKEKPSTAGGNGGRGAKGKKGGKRKGTKTAANNNTTSRSGPTSTASAASVLARLESPEDVVVIPGDDQLRQCVRLQSLADELSFSLVALRTKLARLEHRIRESGNAAVLPFQLRRAQEEKVVLERETESTSRVIRQLLVMSSQIESLQTMKDEVFVETKEDLLHEIEALRAERDSRLDAIRDGYAERINMLQRYWPWRQLLELGDTTVGATFAEELARGPRYRNVGIQNNIQSEYIVEQLHWLEALSAREEGFRVQLRHLDTLVEDLNDINELLESTLTCSVCGLLFDEPVLFWPCGHSFCVACFDSLAIAPSLFRCPVCGGIGSEGYAHNLLLADTVAKWMFKDAGYGDLQGPQNAIRLHLSRFRKDRIDGRIRDLRALLREHKKKEALLGGEEEAITISYRVY